jgi:hypothetical protein
MITKKRPKHRSDDEQRGRPAAYAWGLSIFIHPRMGATEENRAATGGTVNSCSVASRIVNGWNTGQFLAFSSIEATKTEF